MHYLGGKYRVARHIAEHINKAATGGGICKPFLRRLFG